MKTIYKFEVTHHARIEMQKGAHILSAGVQGSSIMVWALVDQNADMVIHRVPIFGTGHELDEIIALMPFIGTVMVCDLVFHVFDGGEVSQ